MITTRIPSTWQELELDVARVLVECGFTVDVEKLIHTVRGDVTVDVYGEESVDGRRYTVLCECKHWKTRVPQTVIHGFRTVIGDAGANLGYIVSSEGFSPAHSALLSFPMSGLSPGRSSRKNLLQAGSNIISYRSLPIDSIHCCLIQNLSYHLRSGI